MCNLLFPWMSKSRLEKTQAWLRQIHRNYCWVWSQAAKVSLESIISQEAGSVGLLHLSFWIWTYYRCNYNIILVTFSRLALSIGWKDKTLVFCELEREKEKRDKHRRGRDKYLLFMHDWYIFKPLATLVFHLSAYYSTWGGNATKARRGRRPKQRLGRKKPKRGEVIVTWRRR